MTAPTILARQLRHIGKAFIAWQRTVARSWNFSWENRRDRLIFIGSASGLIIALILIALTLAPKLDKATIEQTVVTQHIALPNLEPVIEDMISDHTTIDKAFFVDTNDTFATILNKAQIKDPVAVEHIKQDPKLAALLFPQPGEFVHASVFPDGHLKKLRLFLEAPHKHSQSLVEISRNHDKFESTVKPYKYERQYIYIQGTYQGSWSNTAKNLHIPKNVLNDLLNIWDGAVDPTKHMKNGDQIYLVYAKLYADGSFIRDGRLLGVQLTDNSTKKIRQAFWFITKTGHGSYYTPRGTSVSQTFIRVPLDIKDVSSEFAALRKHPITGVLRPHNGTDFRAPSGSKIFAASDGKITRLGYSPNGYGNHIRIDHGHNRETVYAHMSRFAKGVKNGQYVKRGQLIGYVGMTGLATGPHLHYELKINDFQINPLTADLPDAEQLSAFQLAQLKSQIAPFINTFKTMNEETEANKDSATISSTVEDDRSNVDDSGAGAAQPSKSDSDLYENEDNNATSNTTGAANSKAAAKPVAKPAAKPATTKKTADAKAKAAHTKQ